MPRWLDAFHSVALRRWWFLSGLLAGFGQCWSAGVYASLCWWAGNAVSRPLPIPRKSGNRGKVLCGDCSHARRIWSGRTWLWFVEVRLGVWRGGFHISFSRLVLFCFIMYFLADKGNRLIPSPQIGCRLSMSCAKDPVFGML